MVFIITTRIYGNENPHASGFSKICFSKDGKTFNNDLVSLTLDHKIFFKGCYSLRTGWTDIEKWQGCEVV